MADRIDGRKESTELRVLVQYAFDIARALGIRKLLVQADEIRDVRRIKRLRGNERVIWVTRHPQQLKEQIAEDDPVVTIPGTSLTRMSQMNIGLFLAVLGEHIELHESVVCLSGVAGSERIDTLLIANPRRDFPWFRERDVAQTRSLTGTREVGRLVEIAVRFAAEGREGQPIGTIFVLGDMEELEPYLRQLILNPCEGHPRRVRSIHRPEFLETLREYAALDGAFIVNNSGVVECAGTYLDAPTASVAVRAGLGARHTAAAAITAHSHAVAVVISSSSGTVTVFHEGRAILELEKPAPTPQRARPPRAPKSEPPSQPAGT